MCLHVARLIRRQQRYLGFRACFASGFGFVPVRTHDADGNSVEPGFDVCRVVLFDHLDAGATVLRDLIDIGTSIKRRQIQA
jgi:hypothetical protein